jgi:hypothetical protein
MAPERRASALAARIAGARAHPRPALVATLAGLVNGATMVVGARAVGWSTDHLVVPALAGRHVGPGAWWGSAGLIVGISAVRWSAQEGPYVGLVAAWTSRSTPDPHDRRKP